MKELKEWLKSFVFALAIVLPLSFVCRPAVVDGSSMQPTLYNKNVVLTEKVTKEMKHGEVVVFDARPVDEEYYIKRVIGLPGDNVEIRDGSVYVNGEKLEEAYLREGTRTEPEMNLTVPEGEVFVLGDNREVSKDSRMFGLIDCKQVEGKAVYRVYPFDKMGKVK
jgi:signal peptidase I